MNKLTQKLLLLFCFILVVFLNSCLAFLGIDDIRPANEQQARRYLKSMGIKNQPVFQMDYECFASTIKNGINKDTSHNLYPLQNVLFDNGKLVSWIKICDGPTQMPKWETFPPASYSTLNPDYRLKTEWECVSGYGNKNLKPDTNKRYTYFVYFVRKQGIIVGPPFQRFVRQSLKGLKKHKKGKDVQIVFVNSNPPDTVKVNE